MCELLRVPAAVLPRIVPTAGAIGRTLGVPGLPDGVPIAGIAGDQQAALFGQACFAPGDAKCTYGTGAFVLVNTGSRPVEAASACSRRWAGRSARRSVYALEGSRFIAGAAVQWLRDGLGIIRSAGEIEALARRCRRARASSSCRRSPDSARRTGTRTHAGSSRASPEVRTAAHLARATLEAIALQVDDLVGAMSEDLGRPLAECGLTAARQRTIS